MSKGKGPQKKIEMKRAALTGGLSWAILFVLQMIWCAFQNSSSARRMHEQMTRVFYPGFSWTMGGFVIGIVEAFIYGYIIVSVFAWVYNNLKLR